ncbi:MAG TPA: thioredoxin family protein [Candidatus Thermoplasmatota archaeon]|nr:thioredoxin family protein [Candidatus Thermoplasmatota archaeon]
MATVVENPTETDFDALLREHDVVVIDFSATWCAPCRSYTPKFLRAAREMRRSFPDLRFTFVTVDVDTVPEVARRYGVKSVPTTVVVRERRALFARRKGEAERWSGDRSWPELVRVLTQVFEAASA